MTKSSEHDYVAAHSRNVGWVTLEEQSILRASRVAIAGLGGVGGAYAITLARLGLSNFSIADFDSFEIHNINRQAGAFTSSFDKPKIDVLKYLVQDINPQAEIKLFPQGVTEDNLDDFLADVDVYVDGLDFFVLPMRRRVFARCRELGIPALTCAPLGMGAAFLYFDPKGMSFDDYFRMEGHDITEQYFRFIAGLSPSMMNQKYLVVPEAVNFFEKRGPSTVMACDLCAGIVGTSVLKLLLKRGRLNAAPWGMHFDAYLQKMKSTWRPFGNANPLQWLLLKLIRFSLHRSRR